MPSDYMVHAIQMAKQAIRLDEVPVGAVIVKNDEIIAKTHNLCQTYNDPTAHAEIIAIKLAAEKVGAQRLEDCDLYVTLEPCAMCATALSHARIRRIYFGAYDPKSGGIDHGPRIYTHNTIHHKPETFGGIMEQECGDILTQFFEAKR